MPARKTHQPGFPIYSLAFTPKKPRLVVGGGGGPNKSGIKNAVAIYDIDTKTLDWKELVVHEFGRDEDGCMSLAIHPKEKVIVAGVNSPESNVKEGNNRNCRVFQVKADSLSLMKAISTLESTDSMKFQKSAQFSPDGSILATGTTDGQIKFWQYPDLSTVYSPLNHGSEINDLDFSQRNSLVSSVSSQKWMVLSLQEGKVVWSAEKPIMRQSEACEFRATRFGLGPTDGTVFTVVNAKSRKHGFICKWVFSMSNPSATKAWRLEKSRAVVSKSITSFAISDSGTLLGYGAADMSIGVINAKNLQNVHRIARAHNFAVTCITFSPDSSLIVSGSADGAVHIAVVPPPSTVSPVFFIWLSLLGAILMVSIAYLLLITDEEQEL
ncbi:quinon protein alcohol dehydrogenase-like superfamily [Cladochytrium replicatum]|nr:quinon protein alcohol dehydrogenase-like superfamily [Cladochytrium replicatum]